ncbi:uncharacterized protein B0J16DRAFT_404436 [Fusarium flagelliforme]|uniref:uncharacterized protein n=1 Tax=Fusarium flagelliforme TaxID=2675880 RepID=UPI001E8D3891|nr:uncharacterized protein B0J16DRAFT_404436 [Fusarium flagelliforme]KAH7174665.1 hypothetical protein B0J16DRAFT_404436 [Fusarium flagelliforme]
MDCFDRLPVELRVQILSEFASPTTIQNTIRVSPAMLHGYVANKEMIRCRSLSRLISGDRYNEILQDALMFIDLDAHSFAPFISSRPSELDRKNPVIDCYIHMWATRSHRDPFQEGDRSAIWKLWRFFSRIVILAEDYISKAASRDIQVYLCIPRISNPAAGLSWGGEQKVPHHKTLDHLYGSERHLTLWTFTKFEILHRLQQPRFAKPWHRDTFRDALDALSSPDKEALRCVDAYTRGLFGALCWKCTTNNESFKDLEGVHLCRYECPTDGAEPCGPRIMRNFVRVSHFGFDLVAHMLNHVANERHLGRWVEVLVGIRTRVPQQAGSSPQRSETNLGFHLVPMERGKS